MITGLLFRDSIISAANNISNSRQAVDALNVFPVPDGDTGTNMSMTITAAAKEMATLADDCTIEEASSKCASALLRGAGVWSRQVQKILQMHLKRVLTQRTKL